jgi:hypothetical protein
MIAQFIRAMRRFIRLQQHGVPTTWRACWQLSAR